MLRHYFFLRELSHRHSVTLVSLVKDAVRPEDRAAVQPFTEDLLTVERDDARRRSAVRRLDAAVARLISDRDFDVLLYAGKLTYGALPAAHDMPVVGDLCDSTLVRFRARMRTVAPSPKVLALYLSAYRAEQALLRRADRVVVAAGRDREGVAADARAKTLVVANGVDLSYWRRRSPQLGRDTIVFTGAMRYRPNADAARYLIERVFPLVRRRVPTAQLLIAGADPDGSLQAAGRRDGVTVTGSVPDMRVYLDRATVFAAPLRFAAGIQNKLLEAMAMEVPVVASSNAADGLRSGTHAPPITVASSAGDFARRLVQLLVDQRRAPDRDGRRYVSRHFQWADCGKRLEQALHAAVAARSPQRPVTSRPGL